MNEKITEMAIGALLHDVGKILDRTGNTLGQTREDQYRYQHAGWTAEFFNRIGNLWSGLDAGRIERLACYHHNPGDAEQMIVQQADGFSAGQDRRGRDEETETARGRINTPLVSIFSRIKFRFAQQNAIAAATWAYPVGRAEITSQQIMPVQISQTDNLAGTQRYNDLAKRMIADCRELANCPAGLLVENLIFLCRHYMSFVPSTTRSQDQPDISLFDHSLTTAAISTAMYAWHLENDNLNETTVCNKQLPKFALISGDLSGIQKFILDLPRENVSGIARVLRARSFYLSMLTHCAGEYILDEMDLPAVNRIMEAGGRFTLLVHNTDNTRAKLQAARKKIDTWLLNTFHGKLSLNLSQPLELSGDDFTNGKYRDIALELARRSDNAKKRKFQTSLIDENGWISERQVIKAKMYEDEPDEGNGNGKPVPEIIHEQLAKIGSDLPRTNYVTFATINGESGQISVKHIFGKRLMSLHRDQAPRLTDNVRSALALNASSYIPGWAGINIANYTPVFNSEGEIEVFSHLQDDNSGPFAIGQTKPFNVLAYISRMRDSQQQRGTEMLGIFKADVDRLGMIFSDGIDEGHYSIGRITSLSRQLDLFFSGYLNALLNNKYPDIYTEYAGGDDLLLIGPWPVIIDFASEFQREFKRYVCDNPQINISAAIILTKANVPVSQSVEQAEELLKKAKDSGRNRIAFQNVALSWQQYAQAIENGKFLDDLTKKKKINTSFTYRLIKYYQMYQRAKEGSVKDMLWRAQLRYDMARNLDNLNQNEKDIITKMTTLSQKGSEMDMLKVSATYVLYLNRGGVV